jgi:molybdopterin molybdotransferase
MTQSKNPAKIKAKMCDKGQEDLSFDAALNRWLSNINVLSPEVVPLSESLGRILATDLSSDIDVSPFDNSAMDGFALCSTDIEDASTDAPIDLEIVTTIAAGGYWEGKLQLGQAARIMTGAPVPAGADTVVKVEDSSEQAVDDTNFARFSDPTPKGHNIRLAGEEIKAGECVLTRGECITPAAIGLLASTGHACVPVYRRPVVGIISTGEELVPVEVTPTQGKIRNSNSHSLAAQAHAAGALTKQYENISDTLEATIAAFERAVEQCDIVISSGGVSVGDFDFVEEAVRKVGGLQFASVLMRPGKPQTTGMIADTPFFGLPGNPASAYLGFELFIRPALLKMAGHTQLKRPVQTAVLAHDVKKRKGLRYFMRGRVSPLDEAEAAEGIGGEGEVGGKTTELTALTGDEIKHSVEVTGNQSSALLTSLHKGNCLLILPEAETHLKAGTAVECIRLDIDERVTF